jgi:hypothetical protein
MANVEHSAITDPNIHEPKGVAAATSGQIYVANGSGSGSWVTPTLDTIDRTAPASAGATGTTGQIAFDSSYIYICTAANTWKRVAIATW